MSTHTADLDHALAAALHTDVPHADAVHIRPIVRAADGSPTLYRVTAHKGLRQFQGQAGTPQAALNAAMDLLRVGTVGAL